MAKDQLLQSFGRVGVKDVTLLRATLFTGSVLDKAWSNRCNNLERAVDRLRLIDVQDALIHLRSSFSAPKVLHPLCCSPSVSHSSLQSFDFLQNWPCRASQILTSQTCSGFRLPVKDGGLEVRRVSSLALPAFLASAASTLFLQEDILFGCACSDSAVLQTYLSKWSSQHGALPEVLPRKQTFWDRPGVVLDKAVVKSSLSSPSQLASFLAASSPHSGDWLFAMPIASCGLKLDDCG